MKRILIVMAAVIGMFASHVYAAKQSPIQARKELTSIGQTYNNGAQFLQAIANGDKPAVELYIAAQGLDLSKPYDLPRGVSLPKGNGQGHAQVISTPLLVAQAASQTEMVSTLIKAGAEPKEANLRFALGKRDTDQLVKLLGSSNIKPSAITAEIIYLTIICCVTPQDAKVVDLLLTKAGPSAKAHVNYVHGQMKYPYTARVLTLATAFHTNENDLLGVLLRHGAEMNAIDPVVVHKDNIDTKHPRTALMNAIQNGNSAAVAKLIKEGADPNVVVVQENLGVSLSTPFVRRTALDFADWIRRPRDPQQHAKIREMIKSAGGKTHDEIKVKNTQGTAASSMSSL